MIFGRDPHILEKALRIIIVNKQSAGVPSEIPFFRIIYIFRKNITYLNNLPLTASTYLCADRCTAPWASSITTR